MKRSNIFGQDLVGPRFLVFGLLKHVAPMLDDVGPTLVGWTFCRFLINVYSRA